MSKKFRDIYRIEIESPGPAIDVPDRQGGALPVGRLGHSELAGDPRFAHRYDCVGGDNRVPVVAPAAPIPQRLLKTSYRSYRAQGVSPGDI